MVLYFLCIELQGDIKMSEKLHENDFLNQKEVSAILGVKVITLNHWRCIKRYNIPYIKIGRVILYPEQEFKVWLNQYMNK